jgi:hypothetical protein
MQKVINLIRRISKKKNTLLLTYVFLTGIIVSSVIMDKEIWIIDSVILGLTLTAIYFFTDKLNLTNTLFFLIALLVLMHCSAVYGLFSLTLFGQEYDTYIHTYSGMIIALAIYNYLLKFKLSVYETIFMTFLITLGLGVLNELIEFGGYVFFKDGEGLFLFGPADAGATNAFENLMTDLSSDFFGNVAGIFISVVYHHKRIRKHK